MTTIDLGELDPALFSDLYGMFEDIYIPLSAENNRVGFGRHRNIVFGITKPRGGRFARPSAATVRFPHIWDELCRIGRVFEPTGFSFTSVHVNKNVVCGPHRDKGNVGNSVIVSFGDYEGGLFHTKDLSLSTNCRAILLDGRATEHWTDEILSGTKYSLVFYTHQCALQQ